MKDRRFQKSTDKPVNNSLAGETVARNIEDVSCATSQMTNANDIQRPQVPTTGTSWQRTGMSGRICRQYRRQRDLQPAANEADNAVSRLGIASSLL